MSADVAADDRRRRARWWMVAAALSVIGTVLVVAGLSRPSTPAAAPATAPSSAASPSPSPSPSPSRSLEPKAPAKAAVLPRVPPVQLSIPAIGVSQRVIRLGLRPDRTVQVPAPRDAEYPGWFKLGPPPGQVGSSVILGHVDSLEGPAVFYELRNLKKGNRVDVRLEDGTVAHFKVREVVTYPNEEFPATKVYAAHRYRALNLVTCGGAYDKARGGYQSNVVAYTRLVGATPPGTAGS